MATRMTSEPQGATNIGKTADLYIQWLRKNRVKLFEAGKTWWRPYHEALVPACLKPAPVHLSPEEEEDLLRRSGATLLRYFTIINREPTAFWYSACDEYHPENLAKKVRGDIRRAHECCTFKRIDPIWLAINGYECYVAAHSRYKAAHPHSREVFERKCLDCVYGPFEFWGAFVGEKLAGFAKYVVGDDYAAGVVLKLDPAYFSSRAGYGLRDTMVRTYVCDWHKTIIDGFRSVSHDTKMHEFLLRFGYRRVFTDLKVVYRSSVRLFVRFTFPFKAIIDCLPDIGSIHSVKSLLVQEEIRRSFQ